MLDVAIDTESDIVLDEHWTILCEWVDGCAHEEKEAVTSAQGDVAQVVYVVLAI